MRWIMRAVLSSCVACVGLACAGPPVGTFTDAAFYPLRDHYRVTAVRPGGLLPARWALDNYRVDESGQIREPKRGRQYFTQYRLDRDGDGRVDTRGRTPLYDLRYEHESDGSVIWVRTMPTPMGTAERSLEVIANDYVDHVGGGSYFTVSLAGQVSQRRLGTRVVEQGPVRVGGTAGWMTTFDVLALEQQEASPEYAGDRVTVVFIRSEALWGPGQAPQHGGEWPMLLVLGLAARAELHPQHEETFYDLLRRVDLNPRPGTVPRF